jgi:hypothetical protein
MTSYAAPLTQMRRQQSLAQGNDAAQGSISARDAARDDTIFDLLMGAAQFLRGSQ